MIKCQNCGAENADDARFCNSCGSKIERNEKAYTCSKCGKSFLGEKQFCDGCGSKLIYSSNENEAFALPSKEKQVATVAASNVTRERKDGRSIFAMISNIIVSAMFILVCVFAVIAIFGDTVTAAVSTSSASSAKASASIGFSYWFKDGWEALKGVKSGATITVFILNFVSFLLGFSFVLTFGSISIAKLIISLVKGKPFNNDKFVLLTLFGALQYFIFTLSVQYEAVSSGSTSIEMVYGWGAVLAIVATSFYLITCVFKKISEGIVNRNLNIASVILAGVSGIILLVLCLSSFNSFVSYNEHTIFSDNNLLKTSVFPMLASLDQGKFASITVTLVVISFIFTIALIYVSVAALFNFSDAKIGAVLSGVLVIFAIMMMVLSKFTGANFFADLAGGSSEAYEEISSKISGESLL